MEMKKRIHLDPAQTFKLASWVKDTHEQHGNVTHAALAALAQEALGFPVTARHAIVARKATGVYVKRQAGRPKNQSTLDEEQRIEKLNSDVLLLRAEINEIRLYLFGTTAKQSQPDLSLQD